LRTARVVGAVEGGQTETRGRKEGKGGKGAVRAKGECANAENGRGSSWRIAEMAGGERGTDEGGETS
jgi:hypothetical protein